MRRHTTGYHCRRDFPHFAGLDVAELAKFRRALAADCAAHQCINSRLPVGRFRAMIVQQVSPGESNSHMNKSSQSTVREADTARTPAFVMDGAGKVVQWTQEAEEIFGWPSGEAVGRKLSELIIPERNRAAHEAGLSHFMSAGGRGALLNRKLNLVMRHRDGREFTLAITIGSQKSADARIFPTYFERD